MADAYITDWLDCKEFYTDMSADLPDISNCIKNSIRTAAIYRWTDKTIGKLKFSSLNIRRKRYWYRCTVLVRLFLKYIADSSLYLFIYFKKSIIACPSPGHRAAAVHTMTQQPRTARVEYCDSGSHSPQHLRVPHADCCWAAAPPHDCSPLATSPRSLTPKGSTPTSPRPLIILPQSHTR